MSGTSHPRLSPDEMPNAAFCSQTLFGPQDSYYEHEDSVYCHFHYSTRFAHRCAGCDTAILKQFVEVNRNMREEAWHPECYMMYVSSSLLTFTIFSFSSHQKIHKFRLLCFAYFLFSFIPTRPLTFYVDVRRHKFWNVKMSSTRRPSSNVAADSASESSKHGTQDEEEPWAEEERLETAHSIKAKQNKMEEQVLRIWTCVLLLSLSQSLNY
jgi:hypothetical protein